MIALLGAPLLIYVSCDPDTLARDLDHLSRLGYTASELVPFDMIPLTEEVETVCVLRRSPPSPPRVLYEDEDVVVVDKGPHEPVLQDEGEYGSSSSTAARACPPRSTASSSRFIASTPAPAASACSPRTSAPRRVVQRADDDGAPHLPRRREGRDAGQGRDHARPPRRRARIPGAHALPPAGDRLGPLHPPRHPRRRAHPPDSPSPRGDRPPGHRRRALRPPAHEPLLRGEARARPLVPPPRADRGHAPRSGARLLIESTLPGDLRSALERATGGSVLRFLEQKHALGDQRVSSIPRRWATSSRALPARRTPIRPARDAAPRSSRATRPQAPAALPASRTRPRTRCASRCPWAPSRSACLSSTSHRARSGMRSCRTTKTEQPGRRTAAIDALSTATVRERCRSREPTAPLLTVAVLDVALASGLSAAR